MWMSRLIEARENLRHRRVDAALAEEQLRQTVRDAFDAGLAAPPICEATGLTSSRLYQIKRGARH
jgi:hypothetical protein